MIKNIDLYVSTDGKATASVAGYNGNRIDVVYDDVHSTIDIGGTQYVKVMNGDIIRNEINNEPLYKINIFR
ncbi:hypothetical protein [Lactiplantibacillus plantarum]|uniref:hypothetical protein n=1 Tax=Lactiplantibacillus plantarum TaxID=1590 RepID=UPI000CE9425F|nr:hypothetical protein [Lactiplantibacillus plantarum]AVE81513.1 hypothetical protein C4O30_00255 [Lactiplantibacillus plantarum]AVE84435.1 hypothetical protein C4O30_16140 [Lactiplantibacillus plantarum]MCT3240059.1 hypothetical protein [Lactiplantibacillus plantarum]